MSGDTECRKSIYSNNLYNSYDSFLDENPDDSNSQWKCYSCKYSQNFIDICDMRKLIYITSLKQGKENLAESVTMKGTNKTNSSALWSLAITNKPNYNLLCTKPTNSALQCTRSIVIFSQNRRMSLIATTFPMQLSFYFSITWLDMFHAIKITGNWFWLLLDRWNIQLNLIRNKDHLFLRTRKSATSREIK